MEKKSKIFNESPLIYNFGLFNYLFEHTVLIRCDFKPRIIQDGHWMIYHHCGVYVFSIGRGR